MKKSLLIIFALFFLVSTGYCQSTKDAIGEAVNLYSGSSPEGLIGGFSLGGLIGGLLFGGIGFIAFIYGKKNSEFKPMITGIALMAYPYLFKNTLIIYLVGVGLTAALYFWRD